jgi:hypothetical protein
MCAAIQAVMSARYVNNRKYLASLSVNMLACTVAPAKDEKE